MAVREGLLKGNKEADYLLFLDGKATIYVRLRDGRKLLPFISEQKYNEAIKKAFKQAEIDRIVTILDPLTNEEVKKPLYEIASSHMAR